MMLRLSSALAALAAAATPAPAQQATLDLLDGETLYDGGWLLTIGTDYTRRDTLRRGTRRFESGFDGEEEDVRGSFALHHGLRNDLQVGFLMQYQDRSAEFSGGPAPATVGSAGFGDFELFAKWRFYRWDAPHKALNVALIGGLTVPTGEDDAGSPRIPPEYQVGRGSFDPSIGFGATYEPRRWRFNAAGMFHASLDTDDDDAEPGESFTVMLEVGNRFWLEPYPGPFMRLDLGLYYEHEASDTLGAPLTNTGGEQLAAGMTLAFRPRPSLDFQLRAAVPVWEDVEGTQLAEDFSLGLTFGYRF